MDAPQITLTTGEKRDIRITTGTLYRFESQGGKLADASHSPVKTMVDLLVLAIAKKGESKDELIEQLPPFSEISQAMQAAMEAAGLGEPQPAPANG
jgi:hypothetical protein